MTPFGRWAACASLLIGALVPVAGVAPPVCAGEGPRAALVVDTGEGVHNFCVSLPDDEVTGLQLIVLAGDQHGLSYRFGHGGGAVCMLADVGPTGGDCFEDYPEFWGYWRGSSSGRWTWSSSGAGSTSVGDGDVEGWSWGSGNDGSTHPRPPETSFSSVCPPTDSSAKPAAKKQPKERSKEPPRTASPAPAADPVAPAAAADGPAPDPGDDTGRQPRKKQREPQRERDSRRRSPVVRPEPTASRDGALAVRELGAQRDEGPGPPAAGVAALGIAALLGGAGFVFSRRRRGTP